MRADRSGCCGGTCGPDVSAGLRYALFQASDKFIKLTRSAKRRACRLSLLYRHWDLSFNISPVGCNTGPCGQTVAVDGKCYDQGEVNYLFFGRIAILCDFSSRKMHRLIKLNKLILRPIIQTCRQGERLRWEYTDTVLQFAEAGFGYSWDFSAIASTQPLCKSCNQPVARTTSVGWDWP